MTRRHKDSVYVALAHRVYSAPADIDRQLPSGWNILEVCNQLDTDGYYSTAYVNDSSQQVIIASRGMDFPKQNSVPTQNEKQSPFTWLVSRFQGLKESFNGLKTYSQNVEVYIHSVMQLMLTSQQISALEFALKIKRQYPQYQLSFAGHSMGGWLSQIVVYHFMVMQEQTKDTSWATWCVTLDSPGTKNILEEMHARYLDVIPTNKLGTFLERLDITNYLSVPNLINTCNTHIGTLCRLYPILSSDALSKAYLYTIESHRIGTLAAQFDSETGYPKVCTKILDWPIVQWEHEETSIKNPIESLLSKINANLPGVRLPDFLVTLAGKVLDAGVKKLIDSSRITRGFYALSQVTMDVMSGRVEQAEYKGFFKFANERNCYDPTKDLDFHEQYKMAHEYHYAVEPINLKRLHLRHVSPPLRRFLWSYAQPGEIQRLQTQLMGQNINAKVWQDFAAYQLLTGSLVLKKGWEIELKGNGQETIGAWRERVEGYLTQYPELLIALSTEVTQQAELLYEVKNELQNVKGEVAALDDRVTAMEQVYRFRELSAEERSVLRSKAQQQLQDSYKAKSEIKSLFGEPFKLEGQYINLQMLYQAIEERKQEGDDNKEDQAVDTNKEFKDARVTSFESIFSKKEPLEIKHLFTPANSLLSEKQRTNEARAELPPHLVLLQGRAGIGKTTFVHFVTREWALGRLWQEYNWVFSLRFRDLRSGAFLKASDRGETWRLADWIYQTHFAAHMDKSTFQTLWTWLIEPDISHKKVLFILDGYDETPNHHPCEQALTDLLNSDTPKILTSRPYGLSDLPKDRRELEIVGFIDENVEKYVGLYFKQNTAKAQSIIKGLKAVPTLWGSAHIPVTLNVLCGVLESEQDVSASLSKLNTMSGLYEKMELSLLERAYRNIPGKEAEHKRQLEALDTNRKNQLLKDHYKPLRHYLGKLAFIAFSKQQLILTPKDVSDVLEHFKNPSGQCGVITKELLDLGLLKKIVDEVTHLDTNYEFLHLTFQEYYTGHHLLWSAEQNSGTMIDDFAKIKLDPKYQLVLWFVAGSIKDKNQFNVFMRAIAAPLGGDMLGNVQLGLMVRCTAENWALAQQTGWANAITKMLQKRIQGVRERFKRGEIDDKNTPPPVWVQMINLSPQSYQVQTGELDLFPDALKKANSFLESKRQTSARFIGWLGLPSPIILHTLAKLLRDSNEDVLDATAGAIGNLGAAAATKDILARLTELLEHNNRDVSLSAASTVVKLGAAAATKELLAKAEAKYKDRIVRRRPWAYATSNLGAAAVTPEFLALQAKRLADSDEDVRGAALDAIGKVGAAAATKESLALQAKRLADSDEDVREAALDAIGKLGAAAATKEILALLAERLADSDEDVRGAALDAIGKLGAAAATKEMLALMAERLADSDEDVRRAALDAIGKLGAAAATKEILALLAKLLADSDRHVRNSAVGAIRKLGAKAATKDILAQLPNLLIDSDWYVRMPALEAIYSLGAAAATKDILAQLPKLLIDSKYSVRMAALCAIYSLGAAAATKDILAQLPKLLIDSECSVRRAALYAIDKLGAATATKDILAQLPKLLIDSEKDVREAALDAIYKLSPTAVTSEFLAQLFKLLVENNSTGAALALGKFAKAMATQEHIIELIRLLANNNIAVAHILPNMVSTYLGKNATNALPGEPYFPVLATALISGAYLSGHTSVRIAQDAVTDTYHLCGFTDKTSLHISITHAQAQWFIYWTSQIIQSLDEGTLGNKLTEIEKVGMSNSSQKSVAWFDQSYGSTSSSSVSARSSYPGFFQPKAYGLSNDAVVEADQGNDGNCVLM